VREYTKADRAIQCATGERFVIRLRAAAGGGYEWNALEVPEILCLLDRIPQAPGEGAEVGADAVDRFHFEAKRAGRGTIRFVHKRAWEKTVDEEHVVTVHVR